MNNQQIQVSPMGHTMLDILQTGALRRIVRGKGRLTVLTALLLSLACSMNTWADVPRQFVNGTMINDISVGGLTVEEAKTKIQKTYTESYKLAVTERGGKKELIAGKDFGYSASVPDGLQAILDKQNATGRRWGPSVDNSHTMEIPAVYDEKALKAVVGQLRCISGSDIVKTTDARVSEYQKDQPFTIIPEIMGNDVDAAKVVTLVEAAVAAGEKEVNLESGGCYNTVKVTADDELLNAQCRLMNQCRDMEITYTFGETVISEHAEMSVDDITTESAASTVMEVLSGETICTWLAVTDTGEIGVNREEAAAYVGMLAGKYDTAGTKRIYRTSTEKEVELTGPYGWKIDQAGETDALIAAIRTGKSQTREPLYANKAASRTAPDWGSTYVEIDLGRQYVSMFQEGILVWSSGCVTGNVSKNYTTPEGIYSLTYKEKSRVLRGKKRADGTYEYESYVDFWMPFNGGIGLHDANWRSKFGGTIYKTNGSHGCVNLPPAKAKELYDLVYTGIPVICVN